LQRPQAAQIVCIKSLYGAGLISTCASDQSCFSVSGPSDGTLLAAKDYSLKSGSNAIS